MGWQAQLNFPMPEPHTLRQLPALPLGIAGPGPLKPRARSLPPLLPSPNSQLAAHPATSHPPSTRLPTNPSADKQTLCPPTLCPPTHQPIHVVCLP